MNVFALCDADRNNGYKHICSIIEQGLAKNKNSNCGGYFGIITMHTFYESKTYVNCKANGLRRNVLTQLPGNICTGGKIMMLS